MIGDLTLRKTIMNQLSDFQLCVLLIGGFAIAAAALTAGYAAPLEAAYVIVASRQGMIASFRFDPGKAPALWEERSRLLIRGAHPGGKPPSFRSGPDGFLAGSRERGIEHTGSLQCRPRFRGAEAVGRCAGFCGAMVPNLRSNWEVRDWFCRDLPFIGKLIVIPHGYGQ